MKISGILPIGSVLMLKNSTHRVMITGYAQRKIDNPDQIFDYAGCAYPEGVIGPDKTFLFDHEQIETLYALGHVDGESQAFMAKIEDLLIQLRGGDEEDEEEYDEEDEEDEEAEETAPEADL